MDKEYTYQALAFRQRLNADSYQDARQAVSKWNNGEGRATRLLCTHRQQSAARDSHLERLARGLPY